MVIGMRIPRRLRRGNVLINNVYSLMCESWVTSLVDCHLFENIGCQTDTVQAVSYVKIFGTSMFLMELFVPFIVNEMARAYIEA